MKRLSLLLALFTIFPSAAFCQSTAEPKELLNLRGSFEKARSAALLPLEKKYVDALTKLKDQLTRSGDLQGALAVQAELTIMLQGSTAEETEKVTRRLSQFKTTNEFFAWLSTTAWKSTTGNTLRFPRIDTMELTSPDGRISTYVTTIDKVGNISWNFSTGSEELMIISSDLKSATCGSGPLTKLE